MNRKQKAGIIKELVSCLRSEREITRIVIFGSFFKSENPNDLDVAVFVDSSENYFTIAPRLRSKIRSITRKMPVDLIPVQEGVQESFFLSEIETGELVYER